MAEDGPVISERAYLRALRARFREPSSVALWWNALGRARRCDILHVLGLPVSEKRWAHLAPPQRAALYLAWEGLTIEDFEDAFVLPPLTTGGNI